MEMFTKTNRVKLMDYLKKRDKSSKIWTMFNVQLYVLNVHGLHL